jgi:Leucine-rich repeat (LRR) protein
VLDFTSTSAFTLANTGVVNIGGGGANLNFNGNSMGQLNNIGGTVTIASGGNLSTIGGAWIVVNATGIINVSGAINLPHTSPGSLIINGGQVNINSGGTLNNTASPNAGTVDINTNGSVLTVLSGGIVNNGSGGSIVVGSVGNGTLMVNGSLTNNGSVSANNTSAINVVNGTFTNVATTTLNGTSTITIGSNGLFTNTVPGSRLDVVGTVALFANGRLDNSGGISASVYLNPGATFQIDGNITQYLGASPQYAGAAGATLLYTGAGNVTAGLEFPTVNGPTNLTLNKTGGAIVTLLGSRSLPATGQLTLTSGVLDMGATFTMTLNNPSPNPISGALLGAPFSATKMVVGTLARAVNTGLLSAFVFPMGAGANFIGAQVDVPAGINGIVTVKGNGTNSMGVADGTTIFTGTMSTTEYWEITSTVPIAGARIDVKRPGGFAIGAELGESIMSNGTYTAVSAPLVGAAPNLLTPLSINLGTATKYYTAGSIATTYYYHAPLGFPPTNPNGWTSIVGGLGVAAPGFNSGFTFVIPSGQTATYNLGFTVPIGVTLQIDPNGTLSINGNNNLTVNGTITYINTTSKLLYIGGAGVPHTTGGEFPAIMPGSVVVNRTQGAADRLDLNSNKTLAGTLTLTSGILWKQNFALTLNGSPSLDVVGGTLTSDMPPQTVLGANANLSAGRIILAGSAYPLLVNGSLAISGGTLELNGVSSPQIDPASTGAVTFTGGVLQFSGSWSGIVNTKTLPISMPADVEILSGTPQIGANTTLSGNLTITTGSLTVNGGFNLTLSGSGAITTTGAPNRIIVGAGATITVQRATLDGTWFTGNSVNNLNIAAPSTLTNPLTVVSNFGFSGSGILTTSVGNPIIAGVSCALGGVSPTNFVNGPMQATFQSSVNGQLRAFPVGKNGTFLPVELRSVNVGGSNPIVQVEAFDTPPPGGTFPTAPLGNEYWSFQTVANGFVMLQHQIAISKAATIPAGAQIVSKAAPVGGAYSPQGGTPTVVGVYNALLTPVFTGFPGLPSYPDDFVAFTGAVPTTFYYQSGAPETLANWNSNINGSGSVPSSFATGSFYVPSGRTAVFTMQPIFAAGTILQVESGGAITVQNGVSLTANGSFRVNAGGRLTLQGTGSVVAPSGVQYLSPTATLEYNAPVNRLTSSTEFPNTMSAQVEIQNGSVRLDASKQLQSSFLVNNSTLTFGAADRLRLSGALAFTSSNFVSDSTDTLMVDGAGSIAGSIAIPALARLTMNRGGLPLTLVGTMQITQQLGLFGGNVSVPNGASVILQSSADTALVGGNATSFVSGALVRQLLPNLTPSTTLPIFYPIGRASTYLPLTLTEATTGTVAPQVSAEAFAVGAGGTPALGVPGALSTSEYWRLSAVTGSFTGARVGVFRGGITSMNTLASSLTQTGLYTSVGGTLSNLSQGLSLLSDGVSNSGTRYYSIVGTLQGSPRIAGFTPSVGGEGTTMLIMGTNLTGVNAVAIGGVAVSRFTVLSSTTISVVVGAVSSGPVQVGSPLGGAASDSSFTFVPAPVIGGIFPNPAGTGTVITISGSNLGGLNSLQIGGVTIPQNGITANPDGSFTTRIPLTATTSTIILSTPGGTLISTTALTFVATPVLTSFSPAVSSTGAVITLLGQNFTQGTTVRFGDVFAQAVTVNSSGRMSVVVPQQVLPLLASSGDKSGTLTSTVPNAVYLTIRTGGGTVTSATQFVYSPFPNGGTGGGVDPLRLVVVSEARDKLVAVGGLVRVTGANLELIQELTLRTSIGSTKASYILSSSAAMTVLIPTTGLLRSTTASLSSALVTVDALGAFNRVIVQNMFTVVGVPTITGVQPMDVAAGEDVVVTGESLDLISGASIGGVSLPFRLVNGQVLVRIPSVVVGGVSLPASGVLSFTSLGGIATTAAIINAALASGQPTILSFSPTSGDVGTMVVVSGVNFTRVTDALVGGVPVGSFVINSSTQMTITLGAQVTSSSQGGITLLSPLGSTVSLQPFIFASSLAGDMEALERALSLTGVLLRDIDVERTDNRITGIGASARPLNTSLEAFANALVPLTALRNLDLSNTGLTGTIPTSLARFTALESLNLSGNRLTGALVSDVVCSYRNLRLLDVSRNNLEGLIPVCIATLDKVRTLNLSQNRFTGGLPKELGGMVSLEELLVNNNRLTGGLSSEFGTSNGGTVKRTVRTASAQTLRVLDVSANELTGGIPAEWGGMSALQQLNVSNNRLSGVLPSSIVNWESLQVLNVGYNGFTGTIPTLTPTLLSTLNVEHNNFSGRLPEVLKGASRLRVLKAGSNGLTGLPKLLRIDTLRVDSNRVEFGSLEPNLGMRISFVYTPQDSIGSGGDTVVRVSSRLVIASGIGGTKTVYEWLRNGRVLAGATSATLVLESAKAFQSGVYVCRATNSLLPQLTLFSRSYKLVVTGADQTLDAPELLFPAIQAENIAVRPRLKWSGVDGAEQYELTVGRDAQLRDVVLRRTVSVLAGSSEQSYRLEASDGALERGGQYFWRVRALAVGSEGIPSETRSFRVVPLGVDVGFSTIDAGRTLIGTQRMGDGVLVNVGTSAITLDSATAITNADVFSLQNQTRNVVMQANDELPINVQFTPKAAGEALASVQVWYKDAQKTQRQVRFDNALRGRGGALRVDGVVFPAVRLRRTALQSLRVINVSRDTVALTGLRLLPTNSSEVSRKDVGAFGLDPLSVTTLLPKDTLFVTVRCKSDEEADLRAQIQVLWSAQGGADSASVPVQAQVRAVNPNNPSVTIGVKPRQDSVPPGSLVLLDVYIQEGNPDLLYKAADPDIRAQVSFDPQVLALTSGARQLRTSSSTRAVVQVQTRWDKRSLVLATIECRAVAGERVDTPAMVIGAQWGKPGAEILPFEPAVIVEEPEKPDTAVKFTTLVSRAGGTRLIGAAKTGTIAVIPNPASGDVKIGYTLAEAGEVEITLLTASGEVVQTLAKEWREAGEYLLHADVRNVPSGAYRVVVRSRGSSIGEHLNIIR